jgi:cytoskeleton protein RodZ
MSDVEVASQPSVPETEVVNKKQATAGELLREARLAAGLHIAALAVSMKVPVKKLEALEADRVDLLPDAVFVRALASSVCRTLKIDASPILELLPPSSAPQFQTGDRGINAPFRATGERRISSVPEILKRPQVLLVAGILLAAVVVSTMPDLHMPAWLVGSASKDATESDPKEVVLETSSPVRESEEKIAPVEVVPAAPLVSTAASQPAAAASSPLVAQDPSPLPKAPDLVIIRAKGTTWVEVLDSTGAVLVRRTLQADGSTLANGTPPLSVVIGKADLVDVEVRGKPFAVSGVSKDNVARFEVK